MGRPASSPGEALLRVRGLAKRFGDHEVLRGIDLDVMPADRIAILGASGSGKSTLLRCLNFMELPTAETAKQGTEEVKAAATSGSAHSQHKAKAHQHKASAKQHAHASHEAASAAVK